MDVLNDTRELTECAFELCQCTLMASSPDEGEAFCSETCREQDEGGIESETCQCGHPPCDVV